MRRFVLLAILILAVSGITLPKTVMAAGSSTCFGTTSQGRLENGVKLPLSGDNFSAYGTAPTLLGRTYVHSKVHDVILDTYATLAKTLPKTIYIYGETGFEEGGSFPPHKTHQNGLSVDFMVPVLGGGGTSVPLPTGIFNRYGYDQEFDHRGRGDGIRIDFDAIAAHLVTLHKQAKAHGIELWRVLFAPDLQPLLYRTQHGAYIRNHIMIPDKRSWVRHDDHYHVDFKVPCKKL